MSIEQIVATLDMEIGRLTQARSLLTDTSTVMPNGSNRGRPKMVNIMAAASAPAAPGRKSTMSPEGRARIAEAMKKRWAAKRAALKTATKSTRK